MQTFYDFLNKTVYPYSKIITVVVLLLVFLFAAHYLYTSETSAIAAKNPAIYKAIDENDVRIYIFVADWCPACKRAMPEIDKFMHTYNGKTIENRKISVIKVECGDADENTETAQTISKFKVTGFPTIKLVKPDATGGERIFEFDTKITQENLEGFLKTSLRS